MFGFGKKKDAAQAEAAAPAQEARPAGSKRRTAMLGGLAAVLVAGAAAYLYLPDLLNETPPPAPSKPAALAKAPAAAPAKPAAVAEAPKPVAAPPPAAKPAAAAAPALAPEPKPAPVAAPELKPLTQTPAVAAKAKPKPAAVAEAPKPEPKPAAVAEAPKPEPKPVPVAEPKLGLAVVPVLEPVASTSGSPLKYNDVMTAVLYRDREAVTQLLDLGRWADKRDSNGYTPLMAAVHNRDYSMVQLLLERGADPRAQAPGGAIALDMARQAGDGAIESLLLKFGPR